MKLFALPYAGGNVSIFYQLKNRLPQDIELVPIELPGHGTRIKEALVDSIEAVADDIYRKLRNCNLMEPYGLLGYSMGSLICLEVYYKLLYAGERLPDYLYLCACSPPDQRNKIITDIRGCSSEELAEKLKIIGGTPEEVLENEELLQYALPIIRADFMAIEEYQCQYRDERIKSKGIIIYSNEEVENIHKWNRWFAFECKFHHVEDGHFFIHEKSELLLDIIRER